MVPNAGAATECRTYKLVTFTPILRQAFDGVVKSQPETPTVVVEREGKDHRNGKQDPQYSVVVDTEHQQTEETDRQNNELGGNDIRQDCSDEKPLFPFEYCSTRIAVVTDVKRPLDDRRQATRRTKQSNRSLKRGPYAWDLLLCKHHQFVRYFFQ